jgi:hypothetical protein
MTRHDALEAPSARTPAVLPTCCQAWAAEQTRPWTRRPAADRTPAEPLRRGQGGWRVERQTSVGEARTR